MDQDLLPETFDVFWRRNSHQSFCLHKPNQKCVPFEYGE